MLYKDYVIQERIKRGFNQKKLAELLDISRSAMSQIETGATKASPETMTSIKRVFDEHEIIIPDGVELPALTRV